MRKKAKKIRAYITQAVHSVGGSNPETWQNYVAEYSVVRHLDDVRHSHENVKKCVIVKTAQPTVPIPMLDAHRRKMAWEAAQKRLLIDVLVKRTETIGAGAVWTTITLPGKFHSNPTNAGAKRMNGVSMLDPVEGMKEMQHRYHQTMNLLRELKCWPWGFWAAQAQHDGPRRAWISERLA